MQCVSVERRLLLCQQGASLCDLCLTANATTDRGPPRPQRAYTHMRVHLRTCTHMHMCAHVHAALSLHTCKVPLHTHLCVYSVWTHSHTHAPMHAQLRQVAAPKASISGSNSGSGSQKRTPRGQSAQRPHSRSAPSRQRPDPSRNAPIQAPLTMTKTNKAQKQAVAGSV